MQRPDWHLIYQAFIDGALEAQKNPVATKEVIERAADGYVKLVELRQAELEEHSETYSKDWIEDCLRWHGKVLLGQRGHWCQDWDDLPVDDTCSEALCCHCYERTPEEIAAIEAMHPHLNDPVLGL